MVRKVLRSSNDKKLQSQLSSFKLSIYLLLLKSKSFNPFFRTIFIEVETKSESV